MGKLLRFIMGLFIILAYSSGIYGQINFNYLFDQAISHNPELLSLKATHEYLLLEASKIKAETNSPRAFVSSEVLFAPYLNNKGNFISTEPQESAIGYDVGITNGGLYSLLLNAEMPVLNRNQTNNLLEQNNLEMTKTETQIKTLLHNIKHTLALQYLDALISQTEYQTLKENLTLLKQQLNLTQSLTKHGLYHYIDFRLLQTAYIADSINLEQTIATYHLKMGQLKTYCGIPDTGNYQLDDYSPDINHIRTDTSIFLQPYVEDSLSAVYQQKVFENQYKPQLKVYANTGLNSASLPTLGNHFGMSAGVQLSYTIFDGKQKQINHQQQLVLMEDASKERDLKKSELQNQQASFLNALQSLNASIVGEEKLQKDYEEILGIYNDELQKAQVTMNEYLNFIQRCNQNKLTLAQHKIERSKLIVEYNYWNY